MEAREWRVLSLVLFAFYLLYVSGNLGVVTNNDGSHFAATRALALRGGVEVSDGLVFALNDTAVQEGSRYSNKPPGLALLATPLYWIALATPDGSRPDDVAPQWIDVVHGLATQLGYYVDRPSVAEGDVTTQWAQQLTALVSALAGVVTLGLVYGIARRLGTSPLGASATLLALGLGTLHWTYSTTLFSHVPAAAALCLAVYLLLSGAVLRGPPAGFLWGLLLGFSVALDPTAALSVLVLLVALGLELREAPERGRSGRLPTFGAVCAGGAVVALGLAAYGWVCFGDPLASGYGTSAQFDYEDGRFLGIFGGDLFGGVSLILLSRERFGLLNHSPVVWLALVGWLCWPRRYAAWRWICLALVVPQFLVAALHPTPLAGGTYDYRYVMRVVPLLVLPLGFAVDSLRELCGPHWRRVLPLAALAFAALVGFSTWEAADHLAHFVRHRTVAAPAGGWSSAFHSWDQWGLVAVAVAVYGLVGLGAIRGLRLLDRRRS